ncbi:ABC transporter permease subunit [Hansschlegelia sp. KR7-227]|uniref:ABC transporter permease n=1 Tax=Hansschlegelia sp. KR7-227 TaxID=3400914 RepID=UPI000307B717
MRSLKPQTRAPLLPLLVKELWEIFGGRAAWAMLLLLCPLVGFSFMEALRIYSEASSVAIGSPVMANSLSPLDGILVPTFGGFYVAVTLLFPFVAIRVLGGEKESGAVRLLLQLPYRVSTVIGIKLVAVGLAWFVAAGVACGSALLAWLFFGGHLAGPELLNLLLGHGLYALLVGSIALFAASLSDSSATAAIITLAFTIGSWVLDFTTAGSSGFMGLVAHLSLTPTLRTFEGGLLSFGLVAGMIAAITGFCGLAAVWLPTGVPARKKMWRSAVCVAALGLTLGASGALRTTFDVTEDQRNSFATADQWALAKLTGPLLITVHLAIEDPRYVDLRRNVLAKLERAAPNVTVEIADGLFSPRTGTSDERYGEVTYVYNRRTDASRSTSPREILPLIYSLAGLAPPTQLSTPDYPGYPLVVTQTGPVWAWFFGGLPLLIALCWRWSRRTLDVRKMFKLEDTHAHA